MMIQLLMHLRAHSILIAFATISVARAAEPALDQQFTQTVRPFVAKYCIGCHSGATPAAQFDLKSYTSLDLVTRDYPRWALLMERLTKQEMPPKGLPQPPAADRQHVIAWIQAVRAEEIRKNAGDPGLVLARRLSNAEYNYTIRDLTGQDMQPTREFPLDPANTAGFDNSGESLTMSSALLNKYLQAARDVANHVVLTPDSLDFAPHPMLVETDREKYTIQRIVNFYFAQPTDFADYFQAAWRFRYRAALGKPNASLAAMAADSKVSPKYLPLVWEILNESNDAVGPIAKLQGMWNALPAPGAGQAELDAAVHAKCVEMRDFVMRIRRDTGMQFASPAVKGLSLTSQPLANWRLRQYASHRRDFDPASLRNDTDPPLEEPGIPKHTGFGQDATAVWALLTMKSRATDMDLIVPAGQRAQYEAAFRRFAYVFPDHFFVSERGRFFPDDSEDRGRLLSAGFHNVMGYFRDDTPLNELILDEKGQQQLDRLWLEFEFIADYTTRTWIQYFFNQSGEVQGKGRESGTFRPSDKEVTASAIIFGLRDAYIARAEQSDNPIAAQAIRDHFARVNTTIRSIEKMRSDAEPQHLEALLRFAARAYRRPLTKAERDDLLVYYHKLRDKNQLSHEDAIRDAIASVLMSPDFLYRIDLQDASAPSRSVLRTVAASSSSGVATVPLSSYALASRLSYFLWSSMPDDELLRHAAAGDLHRPDVLLAETRRMMQDPRVRDLATEFAGNWLDFRHFETHNSVDRQRFPSFNNDLREAMFQEPVRFIADVIRNNRSVLDMLYGDYTFVNPSLAKHYGMPEVKGTEETWVRVDDAGRFQRGGLLPMAAFLTQSSPGLRTSPVKRGYWVVHRVLGEVIPPPPPVVPELPHDESKTDLPLREVLAKHRSNAVCASCHARFDVFGLAFEGYGPVGEARTKDLAGRPVDTNAVFPGGVQGSGLEGVEAFIREHRQKDFVDGLSRKLLAYALNRSLQLSDEALIEQMEASLPANQYRFDSLVETIVTSPQFLNKRNPDSHATSDSQSRKGD
jgi:mono/diheme cytochrome c family protein